MREALVRLHQHRFRVTVLHAYRERCAACALREAVLLQAAHIIKDRDPGGAATIANGIALCAIHHLAYDKNLMGIDPRGAVHISRRLLDEIDGPMLRTGLQGFHGAAILQPRACSRPTRPGAARGFASSNSAPSPERRWRWKRRRTMAAAINEAGHRHPIQGSAPARCPTRRPRAGDRRHKGPTNRGARDRRRAPLRAPKASVPFHIDNNAAMKPLDVGWTPRAALLDDAFAGDRGGRVTYAPRHDPDEGDHRGRVQAPAPIAVWGRARR